MSYNTLSSGLWYTDIVYKEVNGTKEIRKKIDIAQYADTILLKDTSLNLNSSMFSFASIGGKSSSASLYKSSSIGVHSYINSINYYSSSGASTINQEGLFLKPSYSTTAGGLSDRVMKSQFLSSYSTYWCLTGTIPVFRNGYSYSITGPEADSSDSYTTLNIWYEESSTTMHIKNLNTNITKQYQNVFPVQIWVIQAAGGGGGYAASKNGEGGGAGGCAVFMIDLRKCGTVTVKLGKAGVGGTRSPRVDSTNATGSYITCSAASNNTLITINGGSRGFNNRTYGDTSAHLGDRTELLQWARILVYHIITKD